MLTTVASGFALLADAAPAKKDVVIATLGASAALGGLVLVFLGTVIAAYQSLPPDASRVVRDRTKNVRTPIVGVFLLSMASVMLSVVWLDAHGGDGLYQASFLVFLIELGAIAGLATITAFKILK